MVERFRVSLEVLARLRNNISNTVGLGSASRETDESGRRGHSKLFKGMAWDMILSLHVSTTVCAVAT